MKGNKIINFVKELSDFPLLFHFRKLNWHSKKHIIFYWKSIWTSSWIPIKTHKTMPCGALEEPLKKWLFYVMCFKYRIQRWHYSCSAEFISVNWANWSQVWNTWVVYKVVITNNVVSIYIIFFRNAMIKKIYLAYNSEFSRVCEGFTKFTILIFYCYFIRYIS